MLDFRMETFLAVCRYLNFTRAARALNITQPAVTQHIQYLQKYYGASLFEYRNKQLYLTLAGEQLRWAATAMVHDEQKLLRDLKDLENVRQSIRFGATLTIGEYALPSRLAAYMHKHPQVDVYMVVDNTRNLLNSLNEGQLDFAVVEGYFTKNEFDYLLWTMEPYICVCSSRHQLPDKPLTLDAMFRENLILRNPGSGSREVLERVLGEKGCRLSDFDHTVEISDLCVIKALVREDCGITFLYQKAVEKELREGSIKKVPLTDFAVFHEFTFLWRKGSIYAGEFSEIFRELCS